MGSFFFMKAISFGRVEEQVDHILSVVSDILRYTHTDRHPVTLIYGFKILPCVKKAEYRSVIKPKIFFIFNFVLFLNSICKVRYLKG